MTFKNIPSTKKFRTWHTTLLVAAMILAGALIYSNTFQTPFLFDDDGFIVNDYAIRMTEISWDGIKTAALDGFPRHRYLPNISFAVNYYFGQLNPVGYHIVNLVIHLLTGIFLFFFVRLTLRIYPHWRAGENFRPMREGVKPSPTLTEKIFDSGDWAPQWIAFFAALLWIVQPVGSQAVTYICQRMASMVAMFYILSLLLYVKGRMAMTGNAPPELCRGGVYPRPKHTEPVGAGFTPAQNIEPDTVGAGFTPARNGDNYRRQFLAPGLYFAGCAVAALCALATKENAGTLPIVILLYEWFFFQDLKLRWSRRQFVWTGFFIFIFCAAVIWYMGENPLNRIFNSYNIRDFTMVERVMTEFRIVVYYISLFLWAPPGRLNLDHDYPLSISPVDPVTTLPALFAIIGLFILAIYAARRNRLMAFSILLFFITQAAESTIIGIELIFEHRTYIPFMMVSLMFVLAVLRAFHRLRGGIVSTDSPRRGGGREGINPSPTMANPNGSLPNGSHPHSVFNKTSSCILLCAVMILFSIWTFQRNLDWQNPVTFWNDCVQKSPSKWRPNYNLAKTLYDAGDIDAACAQYEKTLHLHPEDVHSLNNLANILLEKEKFDNAIRYLRTALKIDPGDPAANVNLGNALMKKGMIDQAVAQYQIALNQNPNQKEIYMNLGRGLAQGKNWDAAMDVYGRGLVLFPDYPEIRLELANAMAQGGKPADAVYHYESLRQNTTIGPIAFKNKEMVLATLSKQEQFNLLFKTAVRFADEKKFAPAIKLFKEVMAIYPENALVHYNISCLNALENNTTEAIYWLRQAIDHGYDNWEYLQADPDMDNIRNEPEYINLIPSY